MTKRIAFITAGLSFGDEGKGTTVDYLVRKFGAHAVIRYNGGSQAGHNVVTPEGMHHCFAQFGSGTFVPDTLTYLSRFMFVDPLRLVSEWEVLAGKGVNDALARLIINNECPIVTPFHKYIGQMRELARRKNKFGSCGMGVGEAITEFQTSPDDCLTVGDLKDPGITEKKLKQLQRNKILTGEEILKTSRNADIEFCFEEVKSGGLLERCCKSYLVFSDFPIRFDNGDALTEILNCPGSIVLEGAQGILLDRNFGFKPYVTKSDCSFSNGEKILRGFRGEVVKLGIMRAYVTRHGNGPLVTEDSSLSVKLSDTHNPENAWQGKFRIGWPDLVSLSYAFSVLGKLDGIVLTNLDGIQNLDLIRICKSYTVREEKYFELPRNGGPKTELISSCQPFYDELKGDNLVQKFLVYLRRRIPFPIVLVSNGPTYLDKFDFFDVPEVRIRNLTLLTNSP